MFFATGLQQSIEWLTLLPTTSVGLSRTIAAHPWSILLILIGIAGIGVGTLGVIQTRRWPKPPAAREKIRPAEQDPRDDTPPTQTPPIQAPPEPMPKTDPKSPVTITLPQIDDRHPEVWAHDEPLQVDVHLGTNGSQKQGATCTLLLKQRGREKTIAEAPLAQGKASFTIPQAAKGEAHLLARVQHDDQVIENACPVRFVDYRTEIVETFEDFEKWALTHYPLPRRSLTAREFADRYADLVPQTRVGPLDRIVDVYELANFSEHPVDRLVYLQLVDAFLELEDTGALEGPAEADVKEAL